ncbi:DUF4335 domain-containing protein [Brunnivagina elsteri]|uniref:DUF4335 domain-containing protein n=1 Tax=Brunnivagina elsteri CCALA 953 TaxID=987040 RepID=A0A2A2TLY4_9CYAN|nr:DUF4335 domain-containing protein [Calothrix elsteri]PAX57926.1 hypothetical protein CK510_08790 [Calothrix elsteri CCALA 953]
MPLSNSVIRRYTPPTCTLEVKAQNSPLSQWMGKSVLKQLRFELRFDDPRLPEEERIAIRGDRDRLEALCAVVADYVKEFLQKSPEQFWESYSASGNTNSAINNTEVQDTQNNSSPISTLGKPFNPEVPRIHPRSDIYIEPSSPLSHNLFLGSLTPQIPGGVKLSLLQLFDLASALDEYSTDVLALPNLNTSRRSAARIPAWAPVAAVVAMAVGLTPLTLQYANRTRQQQTASKATSKQETIALQTPASEALTTPLPNLSAQESFPALGLPTPPPGAANLPIPNAAGVPTAQVSPGINPGVNPGAIAQLPANSTNPSAPQISSNFGFSTPLPSSRSAFKVPGAVNPKLPNIATSNFPLTPPSLPASIAFQPNISQSRTATSPKTGITSSASSRLPTTNLPVSNLPPDISALTQLAPEPKPANPRSGSQTQVNSRTNTNDTSQLIDKLRDARNSSGQVTTPSNTNRNNRTSSRPNNQSGTIFDTPQVAEARTALRKRWQPPAGLKQSLEYSLLVSVDGTIERILPLGNASRSYIDRTGMPLIGERFVSPNRNGQTVRIRAVFSPDGKVQTFPEND